jgi:TIR domain-containing protein
MKVFVTYTRLKDEFHSVSALRKRLLNELNQIAPASSVFQDSAMLRPGDSFNERLRDELETSDALLILMSPAWLASNWCRGEYEYFRQAKVAQLRRPAIIPLLWATTPQLDASSDDPIARDLALIQHDDWREIRHENWGNSVELRRRAANLAETLATISEGNVAASRVSSSDTLNMIRRAEPARAAKSWAMDESKRPYRSLLMLVLRALENLAGADLVSVFAKSDSGSWPTERDVAPSDFAAYVRKAQTFDPDLHEALKRLDIDLLCQVRVGLNKMAHLWRRQWEPPAEADLGACEMELKARISAALEYAKEILNRLNQLQ